ncbi:PTH2-domain-containing protein [Lojkania enalia]|uniref:peptidyl-tRNA hydrolase n=1 Tax=Lojkania enalia TaxID=147567 RepID=A0A9P4K7P3_9PLEO|nr:PTH2-domain-containing protein [Didymosphaeria enalia]
MQDHVPPSTANIAIACALIAGVTGYFIGQGKSLGLFGGSPISTPPKDKKSMEESDDSSDEDHSEECKLVLVVRTDLGMTKADMRSIGKIAAQCGHATLACYKHFLRSWPDSPILRRWERYGQMKVALQVKSEEELETLQAQALSLGLCAHTIHDAGRTQIASGSATVLGIGPGPKGVIDQVTGHLKLLHLSEKHMYSAENAMSLSIEEANKIRLAMGLAPLPGSGGASAPSGPMFKETKDEDPDDEPASTIETRTAAAYDNWTRLQDEAAAKKKKEARLAAIKKEREKAERNEKLEGKGLAEGVADEDDLAWLKSSRKRQKKIAKAEQIQKELEERERQAQEALQYTEADLAGIKVGHELKDFEDGEQILVLKDTAVDAEDEDELEAVSLREKERLQERLDSKKRKRAYEPNDMDESGQRSILAQYDEEIDGKKRHAFTLDGQGRTVEEAELEAAGTSKSKKVAISLDILKDDTPTNDYMDVSEVKMKKPKKKKSKSSRRKRVEEEEDIFETLPPPGDDDAMDVDELETTILKPKKVLFEGSFVDDDDLQARLAAQRSKALKNRKKVRPEDIARRLREEASATPDVRETIEADENSGLVIDETSEFVQNLQRSETEEAEEGRHSRQRRSARSSTGPISPVPHIDDEEDVDMDHSYVEAGERSEARTRSVSVGVTATGLDAEETVDTGLGATLRLLKQRGIVKDSDSGDKNALYRERQKFLADRHRAEEQAERLAREQRERERLSGRWSSMNNREREEWARRNNENRDKLESRKMAEIFMKEYKPTFELTYVDEHGRQMNQKEAFKQLSHQFHGKGSGNNKTQKQLEKIAAENKKMAESSLETSLTGGMSTAQDQQSKKHKQAGVRLQ